MTDQIKCQYCGEVINTNTCYRRITTADYYCNMICIKADIDKRWALRGNSVSILTDREYKFMLKHGYIKVNIHPQVKVTDGNGKLRRDL